MTFKSAKDSYTVISEIAQGGMGITYLAKTESDGRQVVVKQLKLERMADWKAAELFEREALTLSQLEHPGIPGYIDYFDSEADGTVVLVQDYVEGKTLQQSIDGQKSISAEQFENYLLQVLEVLCYLHALIPPVIHRDITPKNIIISNERAFLVDFGSVKNVVQAAGTFATTTVGTFGYMAPEQILGKAEPGSDLFSLAMTFIALATRSDPTKLPFNKSTGAVDTSEILGHLDPKVRQVLERLSHPAIGNRLTNAAEAVAEIKNKSDRVKKVRRKPMRRSRLLGCLFVPFLILAAATMSATFMAWLTTLPKAPGEIKTLGGWFTGHADPISAMTGTMFGSYYLWNSPNSVQAIAFNPAGTHLASISENRLLVWDVAEGEVIQRAEEPDWSWYFSWMQYSPDGKKLAVASDSYVTIWRTESGIKSRRINLNELTGSSLVRGYMSFAAAAMPNDSTVLVSFRSDSTLYVSDALGTRSLLEAKTNDPWNQHAVFSSDGSLFAETDVRNPDNADRLTTIITLHDLRNGSIVATASLGEQVNDLCFAPGDSLMILSAADNLKVWNPLSETEPRFFHGGVDYGFRDERLAVSPDGQKVALALSDYESAQIQIIHFPSGEPVAVFKGHDAEITGLSFSPDSKILASGSRDQTIMLWQIPEFKP